MHRAWDVGGTSGARTTAEFSDGAASGGLTAPSGLWSQYAPAPLGATMTLAVRHMIMRSLITDQFST